MWEQEYCPSWSLMSLGSCLVDKDKAQVAVWFARIDTQRLLHMPVVVWKNLEDAAGSSKGDREWMDTTSGTDLWPAIDDIGRLGYLASAVSYVFLPCMQCRGYLEMLLATATGAVLLSSTAEQHCCFCCGCWWPFSLPYFSLKAVPSRRVGQRMRHPFNPF